MTNAHHDPDLSFMREALALAECARLLSPPNPWVGCVLVKDGRIVGKGHTQPPGEAHAEVMALRAPGPSAEGATAYVTLEPCAHHGRTPPCAQALIDAGVARVVYAIDDPDPKVAGKGAKLLRAAGIQVESGCLAAEAERQLRPYLHQRRHGKAFCLIKSALSLDGRVAAADGTSQWISGTAARQDAHRLRAESQAILVGTGTALKDAPRLTVRDTEAPHRPPLRVTLDAHGRLPLNTPLFTDPSAPTLIYTGPKSPSDKRASWTDLGVEWVEAPWTEAGCDMDWVLKDLAKRGVLQVMVEGGGRLHSSLLKHDLADQMVVY
ncbi:MAG: bifunctional diaminohydroxyphosphoribosylaminopyrimidine deaminase/5-amino-6-(5-phosphoribosylamino)uracil reductase RibD, partial [Chlamydiia bacterium]|nr:bifunctional diaminohydroxyphosphoribosylaminopyrimidine deaminase/5-amino-6-(5-phosphoribosylamino)uracil reductase RibD [Chlamydiia bacterium]